MIVRAGIRVSLALVLTACAASEREPGMPLMKDLGKLHHPITTTSESAQTYFDQGLTLIFGFNHDGAVRSFEEAVRLDPECAMCYWGIAVALGPNINAAMGPDAGRRAFAAAERARAASEGASAAERAYIEAVSRRYAPDPEADREPLDRAYAEAMREVHGRHPDDLDAATLYAESLMDLSPWNYWEEDGSPRKDTEEILRVLESVLERDSDHPGANHYYIHAVEEHYPERAVPAADRLAGFAPDAGHLVHMPSHIYWRVGRYDDALEINRRAAESDERFFSWCRSQGIYRALYYPHNIHFLWAAAMAEGRSELAIASARRLASKLSDAHLAEYPFVEDFLPTPLFTLVRFGRWDPILGEPAPPPEQRYHTGVWHYARGLAYTRLGRETEARSEAGLLRLVAAEEEMEELSFFAGTARQNLEIAAHHLEGEMEARFGDRAAAARAIAEAVRIQDSLVYTEPPPWFFPVRQALGAVLLEADRPGEAEAVYRRDLEINPANGWSLYGLARSLAAQGRDGDAALVDRGFAEAWARADVELPASRF